MDENSRTMKSCPKRRRLDNVSHSDIKQVMDKLNHRPRKSLGYRIPHEVFCKT